MALDIKDLHANHPFIVEVTGSQISQDLGVGNSEGRSIMMGVLGAAQEEPFDGLTFDQAQEAYRKLIPDAARFLRPAYIRNMIERLPQESHQINSEGAGSLGERAVSLTEDGVRQASWGGHLLDLSFRRNIALRRLLGATHQKGGPEEAEPSAQDRLLTLGGYMGGLAGSVTIERMLDDSRLGPVAKGGLTDRLNVWLKARMLERKRDRNTVPYSWRMTKDGREIFQEVVDLITAYQEDPAGQQEAGLGLLRNYLHTPEKRATLPHLFRRDYLASGSDKKGGIYELGEQLSAALASREVGEVLTTSDIATLLGVEDIRPVVLHRLEWILGNRTPLQYETHEGHVTAWRVAAPPATASEYYRKRGSSI